MDGKKRIARLRNLEKWKKLGFPAPAKKQERIKDAAKWKAVAVVPKPEKNDWLWIHHKPVLKKIAGPNEIEVADRYGEPTIIPKNPFYSALGYGAWLEKKGWKRLGSGAHSTVYGRDNSDKVIKVTRALDNWIDYAIWAAKEGYAGNLAPKVYSWKRHTAIRDFAVAVVEKMDVTDHHVSAKNDGSLLMALTTHARRGNLLAQCYMEEIQPGSVKFFEQLPKLGFDGDMYGNNIMYRKDGSLCITDPCASHIRTTARRLRSGDFSPSLYQWNNEKLFYMV